MLQENCIVLASPTKQVVQIGYIQMQAVDI